MNTSCLVCKIPLIPRYRWDGGEQPEGFAPHGARGYCRVHYQRIMRNGDPMLRRQPNNPKGRPRGVVTRRRAEVLEEYAHIKADVASVREAAKRMGMTFAALDAALYRARKAGIKGADPPVPQINRALAAGGRSTTIKSLRRAS